MQLHDPEVELEHPIGEHLPEVHLRLHKGRQQASDDGDKC